MSKYYKKAYEFMPFHVSSGYVFVARENANILTFENGAKVSKTHTQTN